MIFNDQTFSKRRLTLSLSLRVSGLLVLAAIVPLLITVVVIELISRPTLITQTSQEMQADAKTHTSLIDSYFSERILEAEGLARLRSIQDFLTYKPGQTTGQAAGQTPAQTPEQQRQQLQANALA